MLSGVRMRLSRSRRRRRHRRLRLVLHPAQRIQLRILGVENRGMATCSREVLAACGDRFAVQTVETLTAFLRGPEECWGLGLDP